MLVQSGPEELNQLVRLGRRINDDMPKHAVDVVVQALAPQGNGNKGR